MDSSVVKRVRCLREDLSLSPSTCTRRQEDSSQLEASTAAYQKEAGRRGLALELVSLSLFWWLMLVRH